MTVVLVNLRDKTPRVCVGIYISNSSVAYFDYTIYVTDY